MVFESRAACRDDDDHRDVDEGESADWDQPQIGVEDNDRGEPIPQKQKQQFLQRNPFKS